MKLIIRSFQCSVVISAMNHTKGLTPFPSFWAITTQYIHRYTHSQIRSDIPRRNILTDRNQQEKGLAQ